MKLAQSFISIAGGILLAAALLKFIFFAVQPPFLPLLDPVFEIPMWILVLVVGSLEFTVALFCLFGRQPWWQSMLLAWLATNLLVYQLGLLSMGYPLKYGCLGSLADPLHLSRGAIGFIMEMVPLYLLLGSYAAFIWLWFSKEGRTAQRIAAMSPDQRDAAAGLLKMVCPACGGKVKFSVQNTGQPGDCPHCKTTITLRKPEALLKMSCFFCKEHIEFPAHALGRKIKCPHCQMEVGLIERL